MRIPSKGQVTIPAEIRERAGLPPQTEVEFVADRKAVRIVESASRDGTSRALASSWNCAVAATAK